MTNFLKELESFMKGERTGKVKAEMRPLRMRDSLHLDDPIPIGQNKLHFYEMPEYNFEVIFGRKMYVKDGAWDFAKLEIMRSIARLVYGDVIDKLQNLHHTIIEANDFRDIRNEVDSIIEEMKC